MYIFFRLFAWPLCDTYSCFTFQKCIFFPSLLFFACVFRLDFNCFRILHVCTYGQSSMLLLLLLIHRTSPWVINTSENTKNNISFSSASCFFNAHPICLSVWFGDPFFCRCFCFYCDYGCTLYVDKWCSRRDWRQDRQTARQAATVSRVGGKQNGGKMFYLSLIASFQLD